MIFTKATVIALFALSWLSSRPARSPIMISDFFVLALLTLVLPYFFFNSSAHSNWNDIKFAPEVVTQADFGLLIVFATGAVILQLKRQFSSLPPAERIDLGSDFELKIAFAAAMFSILTFAAFMLFEEFRDFRWITMRFLAGDLGGREYRVLRGVTFSNTLLLDGILGRLRYAIFPILFMLIAAPLIRKKRWTSIVCYTVLFFLALPMSLSKLPIVYYIGYTVLAFLLFALKRMKLIYLCALLIVGLSVTIFLIAVLYTLQYRETYQYGLEAPLLLAVERVWGETYSIILRYFAVYPGMEPYTGFSGINLIAKIMGLMPRNPDIEVARSILGEDSGSNPGLFFLGGYAAFGYWGLVIFTIFGFGIVWLVDEVGNRLRTDLMFAVYFPVMAMNCLFLLQLALQTAMLTYGVAVVPIIVLGVDRLLSLRPVKTKFEVAV